MINMYMHLPYDDYKALEHQVLAFYFEEDHLHKSMGDDNSQFYHKSIRLKIGPDLTIEFHGPSVKGDDAE